MLFETDNMFLLLGLWKLELIFLQENILAFLLNLDKSYWSRQCQQILWTLILSFFTGFIYKEL